jgi:hypothetical protein
VRKRRRVKRHARQWRDMLCTREGSGRRRRGMAAARRTRAHADITIQRELAA